MFLIPKKWKHVFALTAQFMLMMPSTYWAIEALKGQSITVGLNVSSWSGPILLTIDSLSAFYMLVINLICFCGMVYAAGYLKPYIPKKRSVFISLHLFSLIWLQGAMLLVVSMRDGIAFLLAWELMSLFSFILVIFEAQKEATLKTGINYLLQMHLSFALIMLGFLIAGNQTGNMSFEGVAQFFSQNPNVPLFSVFFIGFGIKSGFIPLHSWLPRAHPAAPSHVSGIMSGIMIKMGIYGILRVTSFLQNDLMAIGIIVLAVGIVSGLLGVVMAIMQHDLKKLLAYHSIENIGIIGIGIGMGILGKASGDNYLMVLGFAGALLHNLNHALFKSLLFFSAGNVYYAVHHINMDKLGGLAKGMRYTSYSFLIGALAISGIPPFNGFISEYLIYNGVINHLSDSVFIISILSIACILALVLIGGLCIYCFTKAFGLSFLGTRRQDNFPEPKEVPQVMLFPLVILIGFIVAIGAMPAWFGGHIIHIVQQAIMIDSSSLYAESAFQALTTVGYVNMLVIGLVLLIAGLRAWQQSKVKIATGPSWGCGYSAGDYRHQYTPTSYADSLRELADPVLDFKKSYQSFPEEEIFPQPKKFHSESKDLVEEKTILSWVHYIVNFLPTLGKAQSGLINHYLLYPLLFLIFIGFLIVLNIL
jgi:hydrogenase-4 component B